jgi:TM2 domain-containing membrane protein YozV
MTHDPSMPDPTRSAAPQPDAGQQYAPPPEAGQQQYIPPPPGQQQWGQPQPYSQMQPYGMAPGQQAVAPKNPAISLLISFFIPGLGSLINGNTQTGVIILALWVVGIVLTFFIIGFFVVLGAWIWGMIDAYQSAQRWNAQHGIIS